MEYFNFSMTLLLIFFVGCTQTNERSDKEQMPKGTFGYDLDFVASNTEVLVLKDKTGKSCLITTPEYQGRILTSTFNGLEGRSLGYVNHERIASKEMVPHTQGYGGEDRFWLGPQGGQFTIYFEPGDDFNFDNWFTPSPLDKESFEVIAANDSSVHYRKRMNLKNYKNTRFELELNRKIRFIARDKAKSLLGIPEINELKYVGFESNNEVVNTGKEAWKKETGLLSIWVLGMFPGGSTVVIPYKEGSEDSLGPIYSEYFVEQLGNLDEKQIKTGKGTIFYKGSGNYIGKIGVGAMRAKPLLGSYDSENNVLTVVQYTLPENAADYVNSQWEHQEKPYRGDVVNAYNDGALDRQPNAEPSFYELESSSPAMELDPREKMAHYHRTFHFQGSKERLNMISQKLFGVGIEEIEAQF